MTTAAKKHQETKTLLNAITPYINYLDNKGLLEEDEFQEMVSMVTNWFIKLHTNHGILPLCFIAIDLEDGETLYQLTCKDKAYSLLDKRSQVERKNYRALKVLDFFRDFQDSVYLDSHDININDTFEDAFTISFIERG